MGDEVRDCSIAAALSVIGERWSLLVVRELFYGTSRFERIRSNTGAPRDILTRRLRSLEGRGVIERVQYQDNPPRYDYVLTAAGRDLGPVLLTLKAWGERWQAEELFGGPPIEFTHACGATLRPRLTCPDCGEPVRDGSVSMPSGA